MSVNHKIMHSVEIIFAGQYIKSEIDLFLRILVFYAVYDFIKDRFLQVNQGSRFSRFEDNIIFMRVIRIIYATINQMIAENPSN